MTSHYLFTRVIFGIALCFHIVALGMSKLPSQIFTFLVLALGTYLSVNQTGATRNMIGSFLRLDVDMGDAEWSRFKAYARLDLSDEEEESLLQ
ncbi:uncharacterized protein BDV14DRAFT_166802 [Aspergillus stella-maris]|uniref:uncharacterized protein n=1 Tax=Aspergillus stella-maris TaxID=1810926 RepID=UPI003CCE531E